MKNNLLTAFFTRCNRRWHRSGFIPGWLAACSLLLGLAAPLQAQTTNTWAGISGAQWAVATNWSPNGIPNSSGAVVIFPATTNGPLVDLSSPLTFGIMNVTASSGTMGLGSANVAADKLNAQVPSGSPIFNINAGAGLYMYFVLSGNQGFTKLGAGTLTTRFNNDVNTFSGPVVIGAGIMGLQLDASLGNSTSITISNGATLTLQNSASATTPFTTIMPATRTIHLEGGGAPVLQSSYPLQTLVVQGGVQSASASGLFYKGPGVTILTGTNTYTGLTTVSGGTLISSTTSTGAGSYTVSANATNGVLATSPGTTLVMSNLTLIGTNNSVLGFSPGWSGVPTVPLLTVTNLLTFVTNVPAPLSLNGGGWQTGSSLPLLAFGKLVNTNAAGVFGSFALSALPQGFTGALVDGTSSNQINLNLSAIVPLVWAPTAAASNWTATGVWSLSGTAGKTYAEVGGLGSAIQFDDSLTPAGPSILVTNNSFVSPNSLVFNNSTHNYTLMGSGSIANNTGLIKNGTGYLTNSLANTYFGNTVLNAGTLVLNNAGALGNVSTISFNGGTLQFSANNTVDYSSRFSTAANQLYLLNTGGRTVTLATGLASSGGSLSVLGNGTLILSGNSTYTGATTNGGGTLKLGANNALPVTTALTLGGNSTTGTLDLAGFGQQVGGLTESASATAAVITNSSTVNPATLTFSGGTSIYNGNIVDGTASGAKPLGLTVGGGSLTLNGVSSYTGNTIVTNGGALVMGGTTGSTNIFIGAGSTFDVSAIYYTMLAGGSLSGAGGVNGGVEAVAGSTLAGGFYGAITNHGTLTFSNNLTLDQGATVNLHLATTAASANNDSLTVLGQLSANESGGNVVYLVAEGGSAALDTTTDYTLINSPNYSIAGTFGTVPVWVGTKPSNYANFTVVTSANAVKLHYSASVLLSGVGAATPASGVHQTYGVTVLVTPGTGSTGIGVTVDFSSLGGSGSQALTGNLTNLFAGTITVPGSIAPGNYLLPFTVADAQSDTYSSTIPITIQNGGLVWNGGGGNNNWSSSNWANGAVPDVTGADAGDVLTFAGSSRVSPVMDNNYTIAGIYFSNNASSFNLTGNGGTLYLGTNTVENDSPNLQTLNVPVYLNGALTLNAAAGPLVYANYLENNGHLVTVTGTSNTMISGTLNGTAGLAKLGAGTLTIAGTNTYYGPTTIAGGKVVLSGGDNLLPPATTVAFTTAASALNLGSNSQTVANLTTAGGFTNTISNGNLSIIPSAANWNVEGASALNTLVDMSGLASFTYYEPFTTMTVSSINDSTASTPWYTDLYLAATNVITTASLQLGVGTGSAGGPNQGFLHLGQSNILNVATINLAQYRGNGGIVFQGLPNSSLVLRNTDGSSAVGNINILHANSGLSYNTAIDLSGGVADVLVNNLNITERASNGGNYFGYFILGPGNNVVNINTVNIAQGDAYGVSAPSGSCNGVMTQGGGSVTIGTLNLGINNQTNGYNSPINATYNLSGGTLYAQLITLGFNNGNQTNGVVTSVINWTNGTIQNVPALDLAITGIPVNLATPAGTHTFNVDAGQKITLDAASPIRGTNGTLTMAGPGNLLLESTNTYLGMTAITGGTLTLGAGASLASKNVQVTGAAAILDVSAVASGFTLGNGQTLSGFGVVTGAVSTASGSILAPGTDTIGTLSFSNSLTLNGNVLIKVNKSLAQSNDVAIVAGALANSGAGVVTVTNLGTALVAGDKFTLFSQPLAGGGALTVAGGAPGFNVAWQNNLAANGSITVLAVNPLVNTNTFAISNMISGGSLQLGWPVDRKGWRLQVQTNSINTGLSANWADWPNSTNLTTVSIPLNPANPSVFFRMVYP